MFKSNVCVIVFLHAILICPIFGVNGHFSPTRDDGSHFLVKPGPRDNEKHQHTTEKPCDVCPRNGLCVPKVQCPAHVRSAAASSSAACHMPHGGQLGICCTTGSQHAADSDSKTKAPAISSDTVKIVHNKSKDRMNEWQKMVNILRSHQGTTVNITAPSFGHHLSMVTYDKRATQLGQGALLNLFASQELKSRQAISDQDLQLGLTDHTDGVFCPPAPQCPAKSSPYRPAGGECNNGKFPSWGAVHTAYERLLPPLYSDGIWEMRTSAAGGPLPGARAVSKSLLLDSPRPHDTNNLMFMQFGQFIAHDTSAGVAFTIGESDPISCCVGDGVDFLPPELQHWACAAIPLPSDDEFFGQFGHRCLNFVRTQLAPSHDCSLGYGKQMNGVTHYPDLSHLYGSSDEKMSSLRAPGGLLKTFMDYGRELPPLTTRQECQTQKDGAACFESGDNHANQVISLTVLHTIWTREHNRVARALARLNPDWNDDTVFFEARRILQAEYQHIMYNEWLPSALGEQAMQSFSLFPSQGYSSGYDAKTNPSLTAEFATAAMRFGHSIVEGKVIVPSSTTGALYETISIPEIMFQPSRMRLKPFLDRLLIGLSWQPMQSVDPFVTESLTRYLFHGGNPFGLDLAAINIQRGRDYGVRPYNDYRRLCGEPPILEFEQFSPIAAQRLASVYATPEDIDLWIGGLLEEAIEGGILGTTFTNVIADQFARFKRGDRYYYENGPDVNPGSFTPVQLAEIKKVTLARLICDNSDGIELQSQSPNAFLRSDLPGNEPVPCNSPAIPWMDLTRFRNY